MICANSVLDYSDNYTYDLNSNRISETEDQGNTGSTTDTITSTYPGAPGFRGLRDVALDSCRHGAAPLNTLNDELTQAVDANTGTTVYGYSVNGSQTSVTHTPNGTTTPDSTTTNEYDLRGQLAGSQVTTSVGTATTTYFYDDSGNPDNNLSSLEIGTGLLEETAVTGTNAPVFETISTAADQAVASAQNEIAAIRARFKMSGGDPAQAAKYFNDWAAGRVTDADLRSRLAFLEGLAPGLRVVFGDGVVMNVIDEFSKSFVDAFSSATLANPS